MNSRIRKLILTSHISFSVGWFGAVAAFVVLNIAALTNQNIQTVRSAYIAMDLIGWYVILPSCFGSLLTGLIQSLGTAWGLFKHYWIAVKLFLTVGSTFLLLIHMQLIGQAAKTAKITSLPIDELKSLGMDLLTKSALALLVLLITIVISVYKPWGKIQFKQHSNKKYIAMEEKKQSKMPWGFYTLIGLFILIVFFIIKHLLSGGMSKHSH